MDDLTKALKVTFESLTKEELIELLCELMKEGLHHAGRKKKEA
jgi:hypothetical protein